MNQRRHRRRTFHRVRQPNLQRQLGRFARGATEQQQSDQRTRHVLLPERREIHRTIAPVAHDDTEQEAEVAHPINDKSLFSRLRRRGPLVPVSDEQIGTEAHQFPKNKNHEQIISQDDAEHRKHEDR